jgi:hypothetical protein
MIRRNSSLFKRDHGDRRVPDGRYARLHTDRVGFLDFQCCKPINGPSCDRVLRSTPQGQQGEHGVHHGRVNRTEPIAPLEVLQHPLGRRFEGTPAKRLPRRPLVQLRQSVECQKDVVPAGNPGSPSERHRSCRRIPKQLVDV